MSVGSDGPVRGGDAVSTTTCRYCGRLVPAGVYCGSCGGHFAPRRWDGPPWLRLRTYAAAPREPVLSLSVVNALTPRLSRGSRAPIRAYASGFGAVLIGAAFTQRPAMVIAMAGVGLPILILAYLIRSDAFADLPATILLVAVACGFATGASWAVLTADMGLGTASQLIATQPMRPTLVAALISLSAVIGVVTPALVAHPMRSAEQGPLDGFAVGALGAACFTAAALITHVVQQVSRGANSDQMPVGPSLTEAVTRGIGIPVVGVATAGMVGTALWLSSPRDASRRMRVRSICLLAAIGTTVAAYGTLSAIAAARLPWPVQLTSYVVVVFAVLLSLRVVLQAALLRVCHTRDDRESPIFCPHCNFVVPDMPFCVECGAAADAASHSSLAWRRQHRPVRIDLPEVHG